MCIAMRFRKGFLRRIGLLFVSTIVLSWITFVAFYASSSVNFMKLSIFRGIMNKQLISVTSTEYESINMCGKCFEALEISKNMTKFEAEGDSLNNSMAVITNRSETLKKKSERMLNKNMKAKLNIYAPYSRFIENVKEKDLQDRYMNKHEFKLILNPVDACRKPVFMAIIIHSSLHNIDVRNGIRETWGSVRGYRGNSIKLVFLLAESKVQNESLTGLINAESAKYGDIVQGDFIDSYKNLTYKNVMGLHWVSHFCNKAKFVLKTDDDVMVDVFHLIDFIIKQSSIDNIDEFFYCHRSTSAPPFRGKSKWRVSVTEYPYSRYPPFCFGYAYLMSISVTMKLYEASRWVKFFWIDDVLITGFVALKAGVASKPSPVKHNFMRSKNCGVWDKNVIILLPKVKNCKDLWGSIKHLYPNITVD